MTTQTHAPAPPTAPVGSRSLALPEALTSRRFGVLRHSLALAERTLITIRRTPEQLIDVSLQPVLFLSIFVYLFGGAVAHGDRHAYLETVLPGALGQTIVFAALTIGVNLNNDIQKGVFDRFRSLPIARSAPLVGAVLGEVVRYVVASTVLIAFGAAIGWRPGHWAGAVAGALVAIGFALCLCWGSVLLGLVARSPGAVQGLTFLIAFPLTFGSSTFVPASTLPGWLQAWVKVNPFTHLIDSLRGLMVGGPVVRPLLETTAWGVGLLLVLVPLATRAYRRKA